MINRSDGAMVYRIARYYYVENLSQNEIAQIERISRSKVSRLLEKARSSGMVNVEIKMPATPLASMLEKRLQEELKLERVIVAPASVSESSDETEETLIQDVASIAAIHFPELLKDCKIIGLGWGRTVYSVPTYMSFQAPSSSRIFVPMVSNCSLRNRFLQNSTIVSRYGERFGAETYYLNISGMLFPGESRPRSDLYNIEQLEEYWRRMDAAVFGLGNPPARNDHYLKKELSMADFSSRDMDPDARGEMLSQTYLSDGTAFPLGGGEKDRNVIAFPLDLLKDVPRTILLAATEEKAEPIFYAAKNGYLKTLITDHLAAQKILTIAEEKKKEKAEPQQNE